MSNWIDAMHDREMEKKADDHIAAEKRKVAGDQALGWWRAVIRAVKADIEHFTKRFDAKSRISECDEDAYGTYRVRSMQCPIASVEFKCSGTVWYFEKQLQPSYDAPVKSVDGGTMEIKGELSGETWMELRGEKLATAEVVAEFLLREVVVAAKP